MANTIKLFLVTVICIISLQSCNNELYELYKKQVESNEKFILLKHNEIEGKVKNSQIIYYIGSDTNYHYFRGLNTSLPMKFIIQFKLNQKEWTPNKRIEVDFNNLKIQDYEVNF